MIYNILQDVTTTVSVLTVFTAFFAIYLIRKIKYGKQKISNEEKNDRIFAFKPKPLIDNNDVSINETIEILQPDETNENCLNLGKVNYLNFLNSDSIKQVAEKSIGKYGVGSCGPRGFYGTIDVHLRLETELAKFMDMEESVLYSYGFSTVASAIGAYCKRGDIIFTDEKISFPSKQGFLAAKSTIIYFKHNDMEDLEAKLKEYELKEKKRVCIFNKLYRKFLVVEGIYASTGTICPLPELMRLRKQYHLRMFLDETISFGALGKTGRGVTEHFGVDRTDIDMIMGSLEGSIGSIGGFCVGDSVVIEHQRLSGLGYCFSASLPPFLSDIAITALKMFEEKPEMFETLQKKSQEMNKKLTNSLNNLYKVISNPLSPMQVIVPQKGDIETIHNYCASHDLHLIKQDDCLQLHISIEMDEETMDRITRILQEANN